MKKYWKDFLSKSPFIIGLFVFINILFIAFQFTYDLNYVTRFISLIVYFIFLTFFIPGPIRTILIYIISTFFIFQGAVLTALSLEKYSTGITGIFVPSILFSFFLISSIFEYNAGIFKNKYIKPLLSLLFSILVMIIGSILIIFINNINQYTIIFIPIILIAIWYGIREVHKIIKE